MLEAQQGRRRWSLQVVVAFALVLAACNKTAIQTYFPTSTGPGANTVLTPDQTDSYTFSPSTGALSATALDTNTGGNLRAAFWPSDGPNVAEQQTCATWSSASSNYIQQGAALRIAQSGGVTRAVTVTKNIFFGAVWIFNFHVFDTSKSPAFSQFGSVNLQPEFDPSGDPTRPAALPWHLCARILNGSVDMKAWLEGEAEPLWGDTVHGGSAALPSAAPASGQAGWYIGHLQPSQNAQFTALAAWKYVASGGASLSAAAVQPSPAPASISAR